MLCHPNTNQPFISPAALRLNPDQSWIWPDGETLFTQRTHDGKTHRSPVTSLAVTLAAVTLVFVLHHSRKKREIFISKSMSGRFFIFLKFVCCTKQQIDVRVRSLCPLEIWDSLFQQWPQEWWTEVECFSQDTQNPAQISLNLLYTPMFSLSEENVSAHGKWLVILIRPSQKFMQNQPIWALLEAARIFVIFPQIFCKKC